jgi:hypothetical protein
VLRRYVCSANIGKTGSSVLLLFYEVYKKGICHARASHADWCSRRCCRHCAAPSDCSA